MRSDREILKIAMENVSNLTDEEHERYKVLQNKPVSERYSKAKGGKVPGYAYGTPKGGVKKMSSCRGRKAQGNKD
jgi:hypothetical protein